MEKETKKIALSLLGGSALLLGLFFNLQLSASTTSVGNSLSLDAVKGFADTGTCCARAENECIIGHFSHEDMYYLSEGPCPEI